MQSLRTFVAAGAVLLGGAWALAAETLDVKTGLWEATVTVQVNGVPPVDTSKLPPEARAKVEEAMKKYQGTHTSTNKNCITKEELEKGFEFGKEPESCKRTVVSSSRTVQEIKVECKNQNVTTSSTVHIEAISPEAVKGTVKSQTTDGSRNMSMNGTFTAKWVSASCPEKNSEKPPEKSPEKK